jgi:glyoxylase-like metal-dependent hydrolase (beta-lactamase superfamily II)
MDEIEGEAKMTQSVGDILADWTFGTLDIHHINTGRGDATFMIFPDGTTMIYDAGSQDPTEPRTNSPRNTLPKPSGDRAPGEWIARYIEHIHPDRSSPVVDYAVISHFHGDHMGTLSSVSPLSKTGKYRLTLSSSRFGPCGVSSASAISPSPSHIV